VWASGTHARLTSPLSTSAPPTLKREYRAEFIGARSRFGLTGDPDDINTIEFEFRSDEGFPVSDQLPTLRLADRSFRVSRFGSDGSTRTLIFKLPIAEFANLPEHGAMSVRYGAGERIRVWRLPDFHKSDLDIQ
jgi:hypothetical protein